MKCNNVDSIVPLMHEWLKENHLLKTSRMLEQEYGKEIKNIPDKSLEKIFTCYEVVSIAYLASVKKLEGTLKKKKTKKETTTATTIEESKKKVNNENKEVNVRKKKYAPLAPPGEFVCPEMEVTLAKIYDRIQSDTEMTNSSKKLDGLEKDFQVLNEQLPADDNSKPDKVLEVTESHSSSDDVKLIENSDSDSSDDVLKTRKTIVKLSNGLVMDSPYPGKHGKVVKNKMTVDTVQKEVLSKTEEVDKLKSKPKSKKKEIAIEDDENDEQIENMKQKSKKRKKKTQEVDNSVNELTDTTDKNNKATTDESEPKKKKKKKRKQDSDIEEEEIIIEEKPKKKKKKKQSDVDVTPVKKINPETIPSTAPADERVKKVKEKTSMPESKKHARRSVIEKDEICSNNGSSDSDKSDVVKIVKKKKKKKKGKSEE